MDSEAILKETEVILNSHSTLSEKLTEICKYLQEKIPHYDWVGFYFADHKNKTLHLGPYAGAETDHTVIPFGKGICGQVAESNETFLVDDVHAQDNYIACSIHVKSEIVVPLFVNAKNVGQIDIDSNTPKAFTVEDEKLLKAVNSQIAGAIENEPTALSELIKN
jgi:GAF domain-containing protein